MEYLRLARAMERIAATPSRREKVAVAAQLLARTPEPVLADVARLLVGQVLAPWRGEFMGADARTVSEALCEAGGYTPKHLARAVEETGELGLAAERLASRRMQSTLAQAPLGCAEVHALLRAVAAQQGDGAQGRKVDALRALLTRAEPLESRYLVRTVLGRSLSGLSVGLAEEAVADAFGATPAQVRRACTLLPDCGEVALHARLGRLDEVRLEVFRPLRPAPMQPLRDRRALDVGRPLWASARFGGVYLQVHKRDDAFRAFTRGLWEVGASLVELAPVFSGLRAESAVLEGEVVAGGNATPTGGRSSVGAWVPPPHVDVAHRLGRKHHHDAVMRRFPLRFYAHDLAYMDGADLTGMRQGYRHELLWRLAAESGLELPVERATGSPEELDAFASLAASIGARSVAVRDPQAPWGQAGGACHLLRLPVTGGPKS